jgi:hypothetical protein
MWFAAMGSPDDAPWTLHLVWKLLHGDRGTLSLLANDPFPDQPPRFIRALQYRYEMVPPGEKGWWRRRLIGEWLPPLSKDNASLREVIAGFGWR